MNRAALHATLRPSPSSLELDRVTPPAARLSWLIAGVQKGGTTALYEHLRLHPQLQTASVKEAHVFDDERFDWRRRPEDAYRKLQRMFSDSEKGKQAQGQREKQRKVQHTLVMTRDGKGR